jgi:hypothetical protein
MKPIKLLMVVASVTTFSMPVFAQTVMDDRYLCSDENWSQVTTQDLVDNIKKTNSNTTSINSNSSAIEALQGAEDESYDYTPDINKNKNRINDLRDSVIGATAISAALSSVPTSSDDATAACGVGGATYSSEFAVGLGCATNVNDNLSLNAGASMLVSEEIEYDGMDNWAAKVGFTYKFGPVRNDNKLVQKLEERIKKLEALLSSK